MKSTQSNKKANYFYNWDLVVAYISLVLLTVLCVGGIAYYDNFLEMAYVAIFGFIIITWRKAFYG